jgi:RNA polymerase sigma factor FliA
MSTESAAAVQRARKKSWPSLETMTREEKILKHMPLVRAIAARVRESLPVQIELDDLVHAGVLGLFDAVDKYDASKNVVFHLYAKHRIRGAILDSLRQLDWASRDLRKRFKSFESAAQQEAQRLGRAPSEEEVAEAIGISPHLFRKQKGELHQAGMSAIAPHKVEKPEIAFVEATEAAERQPDRLLAHRELCDLIDRSLRELPPRYRLVIELYYRKEHTMKQIGAALGVNESRVSQIHKAALEKMATALRGGGVQGVDAFVEEAGHC